MKRYGVFLKEISENFTSQEFLHGIKDDNLNSLIEFCELFQHIVGNDEDDLRTIMWFNEVQFKLIGRMKP